MDNKDVRKLLLDLPGCSKILTPKVSVEDRKSSAGILEQYAPLVAELSMERAVHGLVEGEREGLDLLKVMSPYLFKRQAQTIETKVIEGAIASDTANALNQMLASRKDVASDPIVANVIAQGDDADEREYTEEDEFPI